MGETLNSWRETLQPWLGLGREAQDLDLIQVSLRGLIVFLFAIAIVRVADKRFLSHKTAFDAVLFFMLASMLSRAINGSASIIPTIGSAFVLVIAHRILAFLSWRSHGMGKLIKGVDDEIICDGQLNRDMMRQHHFSEHDLLEDLRLKGVEHPSDVKTARLERSGELSVIRKER
jgi:uncharacterized membrane protein YcaP (DUF421 family)